MDYVASKRRVEDKLQLELETHLLLPVMRHKRFAHGCTLKIKGEMSFAWM